MRVMVEHKSQQDALKANHEVELVELAENHSDALAEQTTAHQRKLDALKGRYKTYLNRAATGFDNRVEQIDIERVDALDEMDAQHALDIEHVVREEENGRHAILAEREADHIQSLADVRQEYSTAVEDAKRFCREELERLQQESNTAKEQVAKDHKQALN
jgi:hypothetical protein